MLEHFMYGFLGPALVLVGLLCVAGCVARLLEGRSARGYGGSAWLPGEPLPPLRPDLDPALVELVGSASILRASMEPALADRATDEARTDAASTAEVWAWLQACERKLADDPGQDELARVVAQVRSALFSRAELLVRLHRVAALLEDFDRSVRVSSDTPYRGLPSASSRPSSPPVEEGEEQDSTPPSFDDVLEANDGKLRAVARRYAPVPSATDDLHQDIRLAVWRALPAYRGEASLRTYVLRVAHYCGSRHRRRQREHCELDEIATPCDIEADLDLARHRAQLCEAVSRLPDRHRQALELQLQGYSYRQIADQLGITESNASVRVSRARKALESMLA